MKKLLVVCITVAASLLFANSTNAQVKIGYFDEQDLLSLFPGIQKVDSILAIYQKDSLRVEYDYTLTSYQRSDSIFKKDSATMPAKARELALADLTKLRGKIIYWQQYEENALQNKQNELLLPFRQQMVTALKEVTDENKYTMVLNQSALSLYFNHNLLDNLTIRVAKKLKLPLPQEIEDAWKQATSPASKQPAAGAKKDN